MGCYHFIVSIYDTSLISKHEPEPINFAGKNDVELIYKGGDEKLFNLFNSRLEFSLEVPLSDSLNSLNYESLFTGDEFKFKVVVTDGEQNILWSGFMLPDSYREPYTVGTYFVNFIATDGISKLKGKDLSDPLQWRPYSWYNARHSISKIIADCLKLTGLNLEIRVDPAIENEGSARRLDKVFINSSVWINDTNQAQNANEILENLLSDIGCVLFQQDNFWYVIGLNTRSGPSTIYDRYDFNGVYLASTGIRYNKRKYLNWDASPGITMLPPYKTISIKSGVEIGAPIFPEFIVEQQWIKTIEPQSPPEPNYWKSTGSDYQGNPFECKLYNPKWEVNNDWPQYVDENITLSAVVGATSLTSFGGLPFQLSHYISLKNQPWIAGGNGSKLDWSFDVVTWWPIPANHDWVNTVNNDVIIFQILIDDVCVASNKPGFNNRAKYFLINSETILIKNGFTNSKITSSFVFNDFVVPNSGKLDIRIHHPGDAENAGLTAIMQYYNVPNFEIKYYNDSDKNYFTKTRNINFTKTKSLSLTHGDSYLDNVQNNFIIQDLIPDGEFTITNPVGAGLNSEGVWALRVTLADYNLLATNLDRLYYKRENSDFYEYLNEVEFSTVSITTWPYYLFYISIKFLDQYQANLAGVLAIRLNFAGDPQTNLIRSYRQSWKKSINNNGFDRYGNVLAELMHDIYEAPIIIMDGTSQRIIWPLDLLGYNLNKTIKSFLPTRISIIPGQNITNITAIEYKNKNVNDYLQDQQENI